MPEPPAPSHFRFGPFEVDVVTGELRRSGIRLRLAGQPFRILMALLARPGKLVTRDELRDQVWGESTFVDFEHGLNAAVNKLRRALGDAAETPRYIETHPGRGYRFIGKLEDSAGEPVATTEIAGDEPVEGMIERRPLGRTWWAVAVTAGVVAMVAATSVAALRQWAGGPPPDLVQFNIPAPPDTVFAPPVSRQPFALSPDGKRLAFTAPGAGGPSIWIRDLATLTPKQVPGSEGALGVFWGTDSRSVFFSVKAALKQANLDTGTTQSIATLPYHAIFGSWRTNGDLVVYVTPHMSYELQTGSGALRRLPDTPMRWAQFLPGTDRYVHVAFNPELGNYQAISTDFSTHASTTLMEVDSRIQYAPPRRSGEAGYLLFVRKGSLMAQSFDVARNQVSGAALAIAQNVISFRPSASACFSVSANGVLVYQAGFPLTELRWYDRAGRVVGKAANPAAFSGPLKLSPDGKQVAAQVWNPEFGGGSVWLFAQGGRESRRLTYSPENYGRPIWSPDGKRIGFSSSLTAGPTLATMDSAGGGAETHLKEAMHAPTPADLQLPTDWSKDGRFILFDTSGRGEESAQIWVAEAVDGASTPLVHEDSGQWGGQFSADGRMIAFISDQSGRPEVYVQGFEAGPVPRLVGERRQISSGGAWLVHWRADGRELFYLGVDAKLYAIGMDGAKAVGEAKVLFDVPGKPQYETSVDFQFDVMGDGQTFVMTTVASATPPPFTVIQNWQEKFRRAE